ncbi:MAG: hypothetical protein QOG52_1295 [Frankiaceae bacterium]|nr:hypothetical protein [Frankiaceae bacterium]
MPIIAASFCPHPPLLIPAASVGAAAELDDLRALCVESIRAATADCDEVLVIGPGPSTHVFGAPAEGSLGGFGVADEAFVTVLGAGDEFGFSGSDARLPLSLTVGAWLLRLSGWSGPQRGISIHDGDGFIAGGDDHARTALLVMGDGAPSRSLKAPGYLDARAEPFDAAVSAALASGDPRRLAALDVDLARSLGVAGWPAWRLAAGLLGDADWEARVSYDEAPYGVGYFVADWRRAT